MQGQEASQMVAQEESEKAWQVAVGMRVGSKSEEDLGCRTGWPVWSKLEIRRGAGEGGCLSF